jgi:hypothetical protein
MFTTTIHDSLLGGLLLDSAPSFDSALSRYAGIAWEDPPDVLLRRTIIIREAGTGDVWAIGAYRPHQGYTDFPPVLGFFVPRDRKVVRFRHGVAPHNGQVIIGRSLSYPIIMGPED